MKACFYNVCTLGFKFPFRHNILLCHIYFVYSTIHNQIFSSFSFYNEIMKALLENLTEQMEICPLCKNECFM